MCASAPGMLTCPSTPRLGRCSRGPPLSDLRHRSITCCSTGAAALACCLSTCCLWRRPARAWCSWCSRRLAMALPLATRAWSCWRASPEEASKGACAHQQPGWQALHSALHMGNIHGAPGASWRRRLPPPPPPPPPPTTTCRQVNNTRGLVQACQSKVLLRYAQTCSNGHGHARSRSPVLLSLHERSASGGCCG